MAILHNIGFYLSFSTFPLLLVNENWKASDRPNFSIHCFNDLRFPEVAIIDDLIQAIITEMYWSCVGVFMMVIPMMYVLVFDYQGLLQSCNMSEKHSFYHTVFTLMIGVVSATIFNIPPYVWNISKILIFCEAIGMLMIGACLLNINETDSHGKNLITVEKIDNDLRIVWLFLGETLLGIGVVSNMNLVILTLTSLFPMVDKNLIIAIPVTLATIFYLMVSEMLSN